MRIAIFHIALHIFGIPNATVAWRYARGVMIMAQSLSNRFVFDDVVSKTVVSALYAVGAFFCSLQQANMASRDYERLNHLSDEDLAEQGLTREAIPQHICETYLYRSDICWDR